MGMRAIWAAVALGAALWSAAAVGQTAERVSAQRDWSVFQLGSGGDRVCWVVTQPVESRARRGGEAVEVQRGDIFLMVAIRPGQRVENEVSMVAGYPFEDGSAVEADIDGRSFSMFTEGEGAWLESPERDDQMVSAMRAGVSAELTGESSRGTTTIDKFSLYGFTAALREARGLCE